MLKTVGLNCSLLIALMLASSASGEEIKCSEPTAVIQLKDHFLEVALTKISTSLIPEENREAVKKIRFPNGDPEVTLSDYVGAEQNGSTKSCSATVHLSATGRKNSEYKFDYNVVKTEDGNTLITGNFVVVDAYFIASYDLNNGL